MRLFSIGVLDSYTNSFPRHPIVLQLYGVCESEILPALVFHGSSELRTCIDST